MYLTALMSMFMLLPGSYSYSSGAPVGSCGSMQPGHNTTAQSSVSSYTLTPSTSTYDCGDNITVVLDVGISLFKGFLCQARPDVNTYSTVGDLTNAYPSVVTTNNCAGEASLTHTESSNKFNFEFLWTHTGSSTSDIYIVCTIVASQSQYWESVTSSAITYSGTAATCSSCHVIPSVLLLCACVTLNMMKRLMH